MILMTGLRVLAGSLLALLFTGVVAASEQYEDLDGLVEPSEVVEIGSQVPGILEQVLLERGDRVEKDQVLARLKAGVEKAAVDLARARVEFGERKAVRNEDLYQKQLISIHEKDEIETEIQISKLELQEAIERLDLRTIRSPIQGVVVKRSHAAGEYVGEADSILTVAAINPLNVEVIVPVDKFGTIKKGMQAQIRPEPPIGGVHLATVTIVDQVIDAASGNFGVRLELPNPLYQLPAGVKCKVRFLKK
jgi:membrane fusion protein (multidrug efflux system)